MSVSASAKIREPSLIKSLVPGAGFRSATFSAKTNSSFREHLAITSRSLTMTIVVASSFSLETVTAHTPGPSTGSVTLFSNGRIFS